MDATSIVQLISTVGFPIVACIALGYFVKYLIDKNREDTTKMNEQHRAEMSEYTQAINNNTLALQSLHDYLKEGNRNG